MHKISFQAVDTLFFRDGSPFNRGELQANIRTIFPPSPTTLIGAIRAAYARANGWQDNTPWSEDIQRKLGDGFQLPDNVSFNGPYLFHQKMPLFPVPAHLLGIPPDKPQNGEKPRKLAFLTPQNRMQTDMGEIPLPVTPEQHTVPGRKSLTGDWWINLCGMRQILAAQVPDPGTLYHQRSLWEVEQRMGNYREDRNKRTTGLMSLYAPQHIRFHQPVQLAMYAQGLAELDLIDKQIIPVGGEARGCQVRVENGDISQLVQPKSKEYSKHYVLVALTPVQLNTKPAPGLNIGEGELQSACHPRPLMLGGWDRNQPRKLSPCLRPGSVLFMQSGTPQAIHEITMHGQHTPWGFGRFIAACWP